jgi:hypothetical protein
VRAVVAQVFAALALACGGLVGGCVEPAPSAPSGEGQGPPLELVGVRTPGDLLIGSLVALDVRGLALDGGALGLDVRSREGGAAASLTGARVRTTAEVELLLGPALHAVFGPGTHELSVVLLEGERRSAPLDVTFTLVETLQVRFGTFPSGSVFRNELLVLTGDGFYTPEEAVVELELAGTFTPSGGSARALSVRLPVEPAERLRRDRGLVRLSTAVGGLAPGRFEGTAQLSAESPTSGALAGDVPASLTFLRPALFGLTPEKVALGQVLEVRGGGLLGSDAEPDEATLLRLAGTFTTDDGLRLAFGPDEAVVVYQSGQRGRWGIEVEQRGQSLVSSFFGQRRGVFEGEATLLALKGRQEVAGEPTPVRLELTGVTQMVHVSFLPGFYDSLRHFGLSAAALELRERVVARINGLYADYALYAVLEPPADFLPSAYARVEIGGPDPNGLGLLGYDNTPGKDVGNVRLFDSIGGANAETHADGFPGYGGVFIDSFLYWSRDPRLPGSRPFGAPPPDPLFDEIFGPVRGLPATLEEVEGVGDPERVAQVERAVRALGNMIGETTAHEVGHSLGLAQPFGSADAFHSALPGEGCLMDAGIDRPLGERAGEPGYPASRFCYDEPEYLQQILGR